MELLIEFSYLKKFSCDKFPSKLIKKILNFTRKIRYQIPENISLSIRYNLNKNFYFFYCEFSNILFLGEKQIWAN